MPAPSAIPAYSISGVTYYPLVSLCDQRGLDIQFDALTNTVYINKDYQSVTLRAGDNLILVNDNVMHLSSPVDIYQGTIVVPKQFKEQVFDILFPQSASVYKPAPKEKIKLRT